MAGIMLTDPGFGRGQTLGVTKPTEGTAITGTQKAFTDSDPTGKTAGTFFSNRPVTCIAVRNTSGSPLLPGTVAKLKSTALLDEVDGAAPKGGGMIGIVDEYLPSTGVKENDVFWLVVSGPTSITTTANFTAGAAVTATTGKATVGDVSAAPYEVFGYALAAAANGKVRAVIGVPGQHAA